MRRSLAMVFVVLLAGCATTQGTASPGSGSVATPSNSPSASPTTPSGAPSSVAPSASPSVAPTTPSTTPSPVAILPRNSVAVVTAPTLAVRDTPSQATEAFDAFAAGDLVYVVDGPRSVAGTAWYDVARMSIDRSSGWVAGVGTNGSAALAPSSAKCPAKPTSYEEVVALAQFALPVGLVCFGDKPITFQARLAAHEATCGVSPGWTTDPAWLGPCEPHDYITALAGKTMETSFDAVLAPGVSTKKLHYGIDPTDWLKVLVVGQFDYPAARTCKGIKEDTKPPSKAEVILGCRQQFVITSIRPV